MKAKVNDLLLIVMISLFVVFLSTLLYFITSRDNKMCKPLLEKELLTQYEARDFARYNCGKMR